MDKHILIDKVFEILDSLYQKDIKFLEFKNSYQLTIGVIMSAQTTDKQVNKVLPTLVKKYPNFLALSKANVNDVSKIISSIGFFNMKAKNIIGCSKKVCDMFNGELPKTIDELVQLPGVGRKSANVILGEVFNLPAIIVDTHFSRVCRRIGLSTSLDPTKLEADIRKILSEDKQYRFSMIVNNHGRVCCHSRNPNCENCVLSSICEKKIGD